MHYMHYTSSISLSNTITPAGKESPKYSKTTLVRRDRTNVHTFFHPSNWMGSPRTWHRPASLGPKGCLQRGAPSLVVAAGCTVVPLQECVLVHDNSWIINVIWCHFWLFGVSATQTLGKPYCAHRVETTSGWCSASHTVHWLCMAGGTKYLEAFASSVSRALTLTCLKTSGDQWRANMASGHRPGPWN